MGCGVSKLEADEEVPGPLRPGHRLRMINIGRNGRMRKDSILSTTELLRTEESEGGDDVVSRDQDVGGGGERPSSAEKLVKGGEEGMGRLRMKGERGVEEELPGSPSLRFYFEESAIDLLTNGDSEGHDRTKAEKKSCDREDSIVSVNSSEESVCKFPRKEKAKRFKSLKKGILTSQNCYCSVPNNKNHSTPSRVAPHPLREKNA